MIKTTQRHNTLRDIGVIVLFSGLLYLPFLGGIHLFDWDEINFAEMAREMLMTKDYLRLHINFQPFYEKPPLFIWMQALSMHLFGINEYAARFPNAICGIVTHLAIYFIGKELFNRKLALVWTGIYAGTILPHWYFKSGIIDPWFNLFIFLGIYFLIRHYWHIQAMLITQKKSSYSYLVIAGVFTGLALLTKGPVALIVTALVLGVYWIYLKLKFYISPLALLGYLLLTLATAGIWLAVEVYQNGWVFINQFLIRNYELFSQPDAGHKGFMGYHLVVFLLGGFPACIFCLRALGKMPNEQPHHKDFRIWMIILFAVVMVLFSIVDTKIIHYSSLTYLPFTFLAAMVINNMLDKRLAMSRWMMVALAVIGTIWAAVVALLPWIGRNASKITPYIKDVFAQENLKADVHWTGLESIVGVFFIVAIIIAIYFIAKNKVLKGMIVLFAGTALTVQLIMYVMLGNVEAYTQRAAVEFFKSIQGEDCYILNVGYKSYAQLFYFKKQQPTNQQSYDDQRLMNGKVDKKVYLITKINLVNRIIEQSPDAKELFRKNGFVVFLRTPLQVE